MTLVAQVLPFRLSHFFTIQLTGIAPLVGLLIGCSLPFGSLPNEARAEIRTITAEGEYRLGDRDTKEDGIRLAIEEAKRHALDQVASYLENVIVVKDLDVTQDEIRSYTAGVVLVLDHRVRLHLDDQTVVIQAALTGQVDTDEVIQALAAVKHHEEARAELTALRREIDDLHQDLDAANQALAAAGTPEQIRETSRQRDALLNRTQSNAMVAQAWTNWIVLISSLAYPYGWNGGMPQVQALIAAAGQLNPNNPHLQTMQQAIGRQPPAPRQPPIPPVPHTVPFLPRMPTYQIVPRPPAPAEPSGKQPADQPAENSAPDRRLKSLYQLNPHLPPPSSVPSSVIQQMIIPSSSQPLTLHTWPQMKQQANPYQILRQRIGPQYGTAPQPSPSHSAQSAPHQPSREAQPSRGKAPNTQQFQPPPHEFDLHSPGSTSGSR
jgi:hypothetical protein